MTSNSQIYYEILVSAADIIFIKHIYISTISIERLKIIKYLNELWT